MVLKMFWHCSPATFSFSGCGMNLAPIRRTFRLFQNDLKWYKFVSQQVIAMDSSAFVFIDTFMSFSVLNQDVTAFELRKLLINWSFSHCVLSRSYFSMSIKAFIAFSTQFTAKFRLLYWYCEERLYLSWDKSCCQIQVSELLSLLWAHEELHAHVFQ